MSEFIEEFQDDKKAKFNALNLQWTLGCNYQMINGIHNLTNNERKEIFYASAHTGVIFDYGNNQQRLLQGHCNKITCTAYCTEKDIIVTADSGPDSMLVIWDAKTGIPRRTILDPHPLGCQAVDISQNGQYLVTLSREENTKQIQSISFWDWTKEGDEARLVNTVFDPQLNDYQYYVQINNNVENKINGDSKNITFEFATTGQLRVVFWGWEYGAKGFEYYSPEIQKKRTLTQTVFLPNSQQVVTGTQDGFIIVWDVSLILDEYAQPDERRVIKVVNLMNVANKSETQQKKGNASINLLRVEGKYLVIGASNGSIRFYDFQFRIKAWFEDIDIASITNLSFSNETLDNMSLDQIGNDDKEEEEPFVVPDFIVVDQEAQIVLLKASQFEEIEKQKKLGTLIMSSVTSPIISISVRPNAPVIAFSCENGKIYEWNFYEKHNKLTEIGSDFSSTFIEYSPDGNYLAVCSRGGLVHMYDLREKEKKWLKSLIVSETDKAKPKVTYLVFSSDSQYFATIDDSFAVSVFNFDNDPNSQQKLQKEWIFAGKARVHHGPIRSVAFGETKDDKNQIQMEVFTIGEDFKLAVHDILDPSQDPYNRVKLRQVFAIEQECMPTSCIWYPINLYKEDVLLTTNEDYKLKLWSIMKDKLIICKKTCLGPTFQGPIKRLLLLNPSDMKNEYQDKYLAYSTGQKVVGIIKLPLDGNPNKTMGLIAHPDKVVDISSTQDGKLFFTCGGDDYAINMWSVDFAALEENFFTSESEYDIFSNLLEGGQDGQTLRDLKDFFYYSQIRSKDEHTTKARKLDGKVPIRAIADMMRSMGYFPTNQEIENMKNEIKFSKHLESGEYVDELEINTFLKLYVNHKPVFGVSKNQVIDALKVLSQDGQIAKEELFNLLLNEGEKLSEEELKVYLDVLLPNGQLPKQINSTNLCDDVLGFEDIDAEQEQEEEDEMDQEQLEDEEQQQ